MDEDKFEKIKKHSEYWNMLIIFVMFQYLFIQKQ